MQLECDEVNISPLFRRMMWYIEKKIVKKSLPVHIYDENVNIIRFVGLFSSITVNMKET